MYVNISISKMRCHVIYIDTRYTDLKKKINFIGFLVCIKLDHVSHSFFCLPRTHRPNNILTMSSFVYACSDLVGSGRNTPNAGEGLFVDIRTNSRFTGFG